MENCEKIIEVKYNADLKRTEKTIETTIYISDESGNVIETIASRHYVYEYDNSKINTQHTRLMTFRNPKTGKLMTFYRKNNK